MINNKKIVSLVSAFTLLVGAFTFNSFNDVVASNAASTTVYEFNDATQNAEWTASYDLTRGETVSYDFTNGKSVYTTVKEDYSGSEFFGGYFSDSMGYFTLLLNTEYSDISSISVAFSNSDKSKVKYDISIVDSTGAVLKQLCGPSAILADITGQTISNNKWYLANFTDVGVSGYLKITVESTSSNGKYFGIDAVSITGTTESYPATGIVDNEVESPINIVPGDSHTLDFTITTESNNPTTDELVWSTSNEEVATVENGVVNALGAGDATITLTVGAVNHSWSIHIDSVEATAITLDKITHEGLVGDSFELVAMLTPSNATSTITWSSSNEEVATVENGVVTYVGVGSSTITASINDLIYATCEVEVSYISTTSITLDQTELFVGVNGTQTLVATVTPSNSQDEVVWSSDDETVVTVENGVVTAVGEGVTLVTVTSGNQSATCQVTVTYKGADSVTLNVDSLSLNLNETQQVTATILPSDANDVAVYSSLDESIATVDNEGNVRGIKTGTTTITVTAGQVSDSLEVTVGENGSLTYSTNVDGYPTATTNNYYVNGYSMVFNKTVTKEQVFEGTSFTTGIQVKSITFYAEEKGTIKAYLCQTGNGKDRDLELQDVNGNVISSTHLPADQSAYVYQADVKEAGYYKLYVKDNLSTDGTEGMINLYALSFNENHVLAAHQIKTNSDSTISIRLVGGIDEKVELSNVKSFGFDVNGTKYETYVALTTLNYGEGTILPSEFGVSYFFTYTFENTSSLSYRSYVTLKDGTTLYSSLNPVSII